MKKVFRLTVKSGCNHKDFHPDCVWCRYFNLIIESILKFIENKNKVYSSKSKVLEIEEILPVDYVEVQYQEDYT